MRLRQFAAAIVLAASLTAVLVQANGPDQHSPSFGSINFPGYYMRQDGFRLRIDPYEQHAAFRADSMFKQVPGLADPDLASFESVDFPGWYLRHRGFELWLDPLDGSQLNREDATFRIVPGLADSAGVSLEAFNFPGYYLRHAGFLLFLDSLETSNNPDLLRLDATFYLPYRSFADSPFRNTAFSCGFTLKNYEDGVVEAPGVTVTMSPEAGLAVINSAGSGSFVDSVDGDDGTIDGLGNDGHSLFLGNTPDPPVPQTLTFTFDANAAGMLPTHAGLVISDGSGLYTLTAVGVGGVQTRTMVVGDFGFQGGTAEDRFAGFVDPGGLVSVSVTSTIRGFEVDHLQWGTADAIAPSIAIAQTATSLWPPNGQMRHVATVSASDRCDPETALSVSVSSNESPDGSADGHTSFDWQVVNNGGSYDVYVRAERSGAGAGRVYTITAQATDGDGNSAATTAEVVVPHDRGQ
jgi:hypothetical protein